jgi:hypothetical protein
MRRFLGRFTEPVSFVHAPFWADCITDMFVFRFSVHTGKPKEIASELNPGKILQSIDNEEIFVNIEGKGKRMLKAEIHFRQLFTKAITEARLIAKMSAKYFGPEAEGPSDPLSLLCRVENHNADRKG